MTREKIRKISKAAFALIIMVLITGTYLYYLHTGQIQVLVESIRDLGLLGVFAGMFIQIVTNVVPVPGEFVTLILLEIYGPFLGGIYAWISGVIGAFGALYLAKWAAKPLFGEKTIPVLNKVDHFIHQQGSVGLLLVRFIPFVPYHFVNYAAGILKVKPLAFLWTTGIGLVPYTIAVSSLYAGIRNGMLIWGVLGIVIFGMLLGGSFYVQKRKLRVDDRIETLNSL